MFSTELRAGSGLVCLSFCVAAVSDPFTEPFALSRTSSAPAERGSVFELERAGGLFCLALGLVKDSTDIPERRDTDGVLSEGLAVELRPGRSRGCVAAARPDNNTIIYVIC